MMARGGVQGHCERELRGRNCLERAHSIAVKASPKPTMQAPLHARRLPVSRCAETLVAYRGDNSFYGLKNFVCVRSISLSLKQSPRFSFSARI
jgi:hypothetical protein